MLLWSSFERAGGCHWSWSRGLWGLAPPEPGMGPGPMGAVQGLLLSCQPLNGSWDRSPFRGS